MEMVPTSQVQSHGNESYKPGPKLWNRFLQIKSKATEMIPTTQVQSLGIGSYKPGPKPWK